MKLILSVLSLTLVSASAFATSHTARFDSLTDYMIKRGIILESIAGYEGACACPFSKDQSGKECGDRSAWSQPGGADPICYYDEVPNWMVESYKRGLVRR